MKYDEQTDCYIDDDDESVPPPAGDGKSPEKLKKSDKEEYPKEKVPKLNKKLIMISLFGCGLLLFALRLFHFDGSGKKNKDEKNQAFEVMVPNFGNYAERAYKGEKQETVPLPRTVEPVKSAASPYQENTHEYVPPIRQLPAQQTVVQPPVPQTFSPVKRTVNALTNTDDALEAEMEARRSPLAATLKKASAQNQQQPYSGLRPPQSNTMSADEYMQNRLAGLSVSPGSQPAQTTYTGQNMQDNKKSFYESDKNSPVSGYYIPDGTIWTGTMIPAILVSGINTDLPGQIKAQVSENVFDSLTGQTLLIPQGTILIAEYNSALSYSQKRVQIGWNTMIRPDGYQLSLGNMAGVDNAGFSGINGFIDDHFFEYLKAMGIISAFTAINGEFDYQMKQLNNDYASNMLEKNQAVINQLGNKLIERALDVQPTIYVQNGKKINVFVNKSIALPPFKK